ncbi:MAG: sialate O-acetylesterase [Planctomycetota bacterium]
MPKAKVPIGICVAVLTVAVGLGVVAGYLAAGAEESKPAAEKSPPEGEKLAVFVLAGQSNMQGLGDGGKLPVELQRQQDDVLLFDGKKWAPLRPPKRFGPEVSFAREMADAMGRPVGIIKFAVGGSHLVYDWNPKFKDKNNYYARTLAMVAAAKQSRPIEILGMLWMQGERDSLFPGAAGKYAANLKELVASAREDCGAPKMTFVLGRVNPPPKRYKFSNLVRKAQAEIDLPLTAWVDCDDLPKHADNLHYNAAGQLELGRRFAQATLRLLGEAGTAATQPASRAASQPAARPKTLPASRPATEPASRPVAQSATRPTSQPAQPQPKNPAAAAKPFNRYLRRDIWISLHRRHKAIAKNRKPELVFLGDSITFTWAHQGKAAWREYYAKRKAANFGISADRTENVLWRVMNGNLQVASPKLVVLLVGTNNLSGPARRRCTGEQIAGGVTAVVESLTEKCPQSHVLVMGVFPRANPAKEAAEMSEKIKTANAIVAKLDDGEFVHFRDVGEIFLDAEGKVDRKLMPDGLHLSGAGFEKWAQAIEDDVRKYLGEQPAAEPVGASQSSTQPAAE